MSTSNAPGKTEKIRETAIWDERTASPESSSTPPVTSDTTSESHEINGDESSRKIPAASMEAIMAVLSERPSAVWYLHQGEAQRGPYFMDSMEEFLRTEQITSDALLWREDWPDWREVL
ncbi:MAG: DUF4339 domain-containing protein, partial [Planctomycetia bacterium]|nr:DUF4339 domain-containing protein [Planctomycetia bacterium]